MLLSVMTFPEVDQRAVSEDAIEACVSLMRHHLNRNVAPSLEGTGHLATATSGSSFPEDHVMDIDETTTPRNRPKKRGRKSTGAANQEVVRAMRKLYKHILSTVGLLSILMERIELLVREVQLDDQPLLSICSASLSTLAMDPAPQSQCDNAAALTLLVQMDAMALVNTVCRRYPRHRSIVIEDLFPLLLKLPSSKKSLRTFPVRAASASAPSRGGDRNSRATPQTVLSVDKAKSPGVGAVINPTARQREQLSHIQIITGLILNLVQGCVVMPLPIANHNESGNYDDTTMIAAKLVTATQNNGSHLPRLSSGLNGCRPIIEQFVSEFVMRCSRKGEEGGASEFRPILSNLVEDLLSIRMLPEFPAADAILVSFCRRLSHDLLSCSSLGGNRSSKIVAETTYLSTACDTLGKICADIAGNLLRHREHPFVLPSAAELNNEDGLPGQAEEVCRCPCGRPNLVETFMLDCDRCHAWFHGSCVSVAKDKLPELWFCDSCQVALVVIDQTRAFASRCAKRRIGRADKQSVGDDDETDQKDCAPVGPLGEDFVPDDVDAGHIFRQLLINTLTPPSSSMAAVAREYHLAAWIDDLDRLRDSAVLSRRNEGALDVELMCVYFLDQWHAAFGDGGSKSLAKAGAGDGCDIRVRGAGSIVSSSKGRQLSDSGVSRLIETLSATKSELSEAFPKLLGVLLGLMSDESHVPLRKLAVKAISQVSLRKVMMLCVIKMHEIPFLRFMSEIEYTSYMHSAFSSLLPSSLVPFPY